MKDGTHNGTFVLDGQALRDLMTGAWLQGHEAGSGKSMVGMGCELRGDEAMAVREQASEAAENSVEYRRTEAETDRDKWYDNDDLPEGPSHLIHAVKFLPTREDRQDINHKAHDLLRPSDD